MGFKDFHLKLKALRLRRFFIGGDGNREKGYENGKRASWMMPISHGYHVVDDQSSFRGGSHESDSDSVVVQREQFEDMELWFFGVFDARLGDGVTKYMQSHLFDKKPKESQIKRKSKETMRKAYLGARAKLRETQKPEETWKAGSASAIVINGDKLVIANMGDYKAIVCRDGDAYQISRRKQQAAKRHWSRRFIPGAIRMPKVRILACDPGNAMNAKPSKSLELLVGTEKIDTDTEFVILASSGIWEVMKHQEAVNLIRHIEDPQEAAECLAKEALTRMSRSNISCLVIRFD
ncbi:putative protein phosphatase 2C-like protein 44 [Cornus florida]|uniref:putative protein phosphatase 2C-like protein 44 n=1 Tax=Cornus florida TaxID=4283 RepID=UPI0028A1790D|nr:putative protein phosphatase 2C-like protein 44 [Cornus florida]